MAVRLESSEMMTVVMLFIGPVLGMSADKNRVVCAAAPSLNRVPRSSTGDDRGAGGSRIITVVKKNNANSTRGPTTNAVVQCRTLSTSLIPISASCFFEALNICKFHGCYILNPRRVPNFDFASENPEKFKIRYIIIIIIYLYTNY